MSYNTVFVKNMRSYLTKMVTLLRSHFQLILLGITCERVYLFYLLYTFPITSHLESIMMMGGITGHSLVSFLTFLIAFTFLFVLFGLAWWQVRRVQDQTTLWI